MCEFAPTFPAAAGIMTNDWSMHRPAAALHGRGVAAEQAPPFNTDYADASPKALRRAGCIVILPIVFPLSVPAWRASPSLFRPFTPAALITGEYYRFFNRAAVRLNGFFFPTDDGRTAAPVLCCNMPMFFFFFYPPEHRIGLDAGSRGGTAAVKNLSTWPPEICVSGTERDEEIETFSSRAIKRSGFSSFTSVWTHSGDGF